LTAAKEVPVHQRWKAFWARLFGGSRAWSRRDKVLEYVVHRVDDGAPLREVIHEEYVRRMATQSEIERVLADPKVLQGARERMRRDPGFEGMTARPAPRANQPAATTPVGRPDGGTDGL
jgi:hypothetical protein